MKAFTLIELLIVVAIIAILAAIAVPNFLEAQTRSKVSRVRSDFRVLATALESYRVDYNKYPPVNDSLSELSPRLRPLSSPISYITSIPQDVFERDRSNFVGVGSLQDPSGRSFMYNTSNITFGLGNSTADETSRGSWSITSGGPDREVTFPYYAFSPNFIFSGSYIFQIYDPTNGTISPGELFARGGSKQPPVPAIDVY
jgi:type II secretion system protein G